jgi:hypothetical protein
MIDAWRGAQQQTVIDWDRYKAYQSYRDQIDEQECIRREYKAAR